MLLDCRLHYENHITIVPRTISCFWCLWCNYAHLPGYVYRLSGLNNVVVPEATDVDDDDPTNKRVSEVNAVGSASSIGLASHGDSLRERDTQEVEQVSRIHISSIFLVRSLFLIGWRKSGSLFGNREEAPLGLLKLANKHSASLCRLLSHDDETGLVTNVSHIDRGTHCLNVDWNWICPKLATK